MERGDGSIVANTLALSFNVAHRHKALFQLNFYSKCRFSPFGVLPEAAVFFLTPRRQTENYLLFTQKSIWSRLHYVPGTTGEKKNGGRKRENRNPYFVSSFFVESTTPEANGT
ncbi:hypothetical protein CEXT_465231 [Caerostris extrusa]|uniref:Uncharacterized protein n=1 Tax=Caerostris extrusa TaxID=172846 RepID=A0AAV4WSC4_CAEEX|nr:hypothetical protein CEXT_465231 [Caerostris extrusa]